MKCSKCGKENADGNWVCGSCGEPLAASSKQYGPYESDYVDSGLSGSTPTPIKSGNSNTIVKLVATVLIVIMAAILIWNFFLKDDVSTPGGTMQAYINAISNDDCDTLYDLTPTDLVPANRDEAANWCSQIMGLLNVEYTNYKTTRETIDGDAATVEFQVTVEAMGQSMPLDMSMQLVKEGGKWKVQPQ